MKLTFVPHLLPVNRGILATCYARLKDGVTMEDLLRVYHERYDGEYFVRLLPQGRVADIKNVWYSNFCDVSLHMDPRTNTFVAISAIDNMVKGAAGQAVQNMNLAFGLDETEGLRLFPPGVLIPARTARQHREMARESRGHRKQKYNLWVGRGCVRT